MAAPTPSPSPSPSPLVSPPLLPTQESPAPWFPLLIVGGDHLHDRHHPHLLRIALFMMACMVGLVTFLCIISIILKRYYSRTHNTNTAPILFHVNGDSSVVSDHSEGPLIDHPIWFIRTEGLQQPLIDSIAVFKYRKEDGMIDGTECSVCLGEFQQDESLRLLPKCTHAFHIPCIDTWLTSHKNCPLCRAPVLHEPAAHANGNGSRSSSMEVRATESDSNVSVQSPEARVEDFDAGAALGEGGIGNDDDEEDEDGGESEILGLPHGDKVNCHPSILIGSQEVEEGIQPMRRSVSMDSSSASMIFHNVVDLTCQVEGSVSHVGDKLNSGSKGSGSSTIYKLASMGRALQKRPISFKGSFSHSTRFLFSRHCRSQSSTLPL